jgi:uncharacterized protein (TIGR01777 family)
LAKHILITGASGLVGTRLTEILLDKGYLVAHLGRAKREGRVKSFVWNVDNFAIEPSALKGITTIIHLAGAGVADKRWTEKRKKEILDSRVNSSRLLYEELKKGHHQVTEFISASAVGYYGVDDEKTFTEDDSPAKDFMAEVTRRWEEEVKNIESLGIRTVNMRTGIVLSARGGALKQMMTPIKLFAGAPLGSGQQNIPWIHIDDICQMYVKAMEDDSMIHAYNAVGPSSVTNTELTKAIAKILKRPLFLPNIPAFVLKLVLGEMAFYVLNGAKVSSEKIQKAGYQFKFKTLEDALKNLLAK